MDKIETRVAVIEERLNQFDKSIERLESNLVKLNENLDSIIKLFNKYQGMALAAIFGLTALWTTITFGLNLYFKQ